MSKGSELVGHDACRPLHSYQRNDLSFGHAQGSKEDRYQAELVDWVRLGET